MKRKHSNKEMKSKNVKVIDLFCGVGGLSYGFVKEKFDVVAGIDYDLSCKYAFETNNNAIFLHKNLTHTSSKYINSLFPQNSLKILIGCAPCTSFSTLTQKYKDHNQWRLLYSFSRIINDVRPDIISMENVPRLLAYKGGKVFNDFNNMLKKANYNVFYKVVNCADYGIPQKRNRLILLASKLGEISLLKETHTVKEYVTVKDAIYHLPKIEAGETDIKDPLHRSRNLSPLNRKRIILTPEGGGWENWNEDIKLECHKRKSGKTFRNVYGRMKWNDVAPTLTTLCTGYGNGRYGHPSQNRAISLREAAILQSFPIGYAFFDPEVKFSYKNIEKHIGNAVPVALARIIAKSIKVHLEQYRKKIR